MSAHSQPFIQSRPVPAGTGAGTDRWVSRFARGRFVRYRLLCFPYAGASGAVYRQWADLLPDDVQVCGVELPGRWARRQDPVFTRIEPLVEELVGALTPILDLPFSVYGHSFGALLAFEVVRALRRHGLPTPQVLFVGAHGAPHVPRSLPQLHRLSDNDFLRACAQRYEAIDARLLDDPGMLEIIAPPIRADLTVLENYEFREDAPLDLPIWTFGGRADRTVTDTAFRSWALHTTIAAPCTYLPGSHLFLKQSPANLVAHIRAVLAARGGRP